jgi:hypothetical protein
MSVVVTYSPLVWDNCLRLMSVKHCIIMTQALQW